MKKPVVVSLIVLFTVCGFLCAEKTDAGSAAKFPERPVTAWVPWGAGGGSDLVFRALGEAFVKHSGGQPQLIKNVPGAAGAVGIVEYMRTARPDGYDVMTWAGAQTIKTHVSKVNYSVADFKPVIKVISNYTYILVQNKSPFKTLKDFVDYAKANPGKVIMGHAGTGGGAHLSCILFNAKAGIDVTYVPFEGGGPAAAGLLAGQTMVSMNIPPEGLSNIEAGQLRALAVLAPKRLPQLPNIPTAKEAGFDVVYFQSRGVVTHKGTPDDIVAKLHEIYRKALNEDSVKKKMNDMITEITYAGPAEYGKELLDEDKLFEKIIREHKIGDKYKQ
jgi:tripartite-type tricarboxylate transporter receptor subunit TctC